MGIFKNIDFDNLPAGFNETAVREEIITPLLQLLGYSAFDEKNQILRAPSVQHPYTMIGCKKYAYIIPDYLIRVNGKMPLF